MGKYYCDYCDIYLTHDSMNARKAHNTGRNHVSNVRDYFASLGHDRAQNIIDQIVQQHEGGGRQQMMAAPSMRLGAGFMNPMMPMPSFPPNFAPTSGPPPFRPPFPPSGAPFSPSGSMSLPPFPPNLANGAGSPNGGGPGGAMPPFPPFGANDGGFGGPNGPPPSMNGLSGGMPPMSFTPQQGPPPTGNPGIHPDRLRMMGH